MDLGGFKAGSKVIWFDPPDSQKDKFYRKGSNGEWVGKVCNVVSVSPDLGTLLVSNGGAWYTNLKPERLRMATDEEIASTRSYDRDAGEGEFAKAVESARKNSAK